MTTRALPSPCRRMQRLECAQWSERNTPTAARPNGRAANFKRCRQNRGMGLKEVPFGAGRVETGWMRYGGGRCALGTTLPVPGSGNVYPGRQERADDPAHRRACQSQCRFQCRFPKLRLVAGKPDARRRHPPSPRLRGTEDSGQGSCRTAKPLRPPLTSSPPARADTGKEIDMRTLDSDDGGGRRCEHVLEHASPRPPYPPFGRRGRGRRS